MDPDPYWECGSGSGKQSYGSESTWIRIYLAVMDPDPYWECGSGSWSMEICQNLQINLVFCLSKRLLYLRMYVFDLLPILSVFFM
jgi:hypothetical protein